MKAYSSDLRECVGRAVDQGYKRTDIIKMFGVSRATIKRYLKQRRETGYLHRKPIPGPQISSRFCLCMRNLSVKNSMSVRYTHPSDGFFNRQPGEKEMSLGEETEGIRSPSFSQNRKWKKEPEKRWQRNPASQLHNVTQRNDACAG